jgi:molecular chaperone GrpE
MSETDTSNVRVSDRRRFDAEGNPIPQAEQAGQGAAGKEPVPAEACESEEALAPEVPEEIKHLRDELEASRKRIDELARAYQSVSQDREDFKARLNRERERMIDVEKGNVALSLVEAIDELDLCLNAAANDQSSLAQGVRLIRGNLLAKLTSVGVERFDPVGKTFDPNLAEAADMEVTTDPSQDQLVTGEVRAGYRLKGRVIRPARVRVAKYIAPAQA